ncbi:MAG: GNAT family N-acetyltransferase [Marinicaulis sp.]|nr:GNAT family N-acetyltransferase [Marinicaulis sp.]NNL90273.1 GNAT family N-acetyltransferase [Marinicaulis sp.]
MVNIIDKKTEAIIDPSAHHLDEMAEIFISGQNEHYLRMPEIFCMPDNRVEIIQYLRSFLKPKNPLRRRHKFGCVWIRDDKIGGYILYKLNLSSDVFFGENRWTCFIEDIAVAPAFQKQGIASALMTHLLENELVSYKPCMVSGQVWRNNIASEGLFEKHLFEDSSKTYFRILH